jgi:Trypsin-co-occurring domain 1
VPLRDLFTAGSVSVNVVRRSSLGCDGGDLVADFVKVVLDDGTEVVFQSAESDLVKPYGGPPVVDRYEAAMDALGAMAHATQRVARSFREKMEPDELSLEIGVGLSGEVGWFFAKSKLEATLTMTLTWKGEPPADPAVGGGSES